MRWSSRALVLSALAAASVVAGGVAGAAGNDGCRPAKQKTVHICKATKPPRDITAIVGRLTPGTQIIAPTTIPFTSAFQPDDGNVQNLLTIGPIHIDGLCRKTSNPGVGGSGGKRGGGGSGKPTYPAPFLTIGGESEAKVLVWTESGSLSFKGQVGPRVNIPPGQPDYGIGDLRPGVTGDPVAGEGDHMFAAASNENADEIRATDPAADNYSNPAVRKLNRYPGFNYGSGPIATSTGHEMIANMLAGFDTLGFYDQCVFSGTVKVIS